MRTDLLVAAFVLAFASCHRNQVEPEAVKDLALICNSDLSAGVSLLASDRARVVAAVGWLGTHKTDLRTPAARDLVDKLQTGDWTSGDAAVRAERDRWKMQPCRLADAYAALVARSAYARDLGAVCETSWTLLQHTELVGGAKAESAEGKTLLGKLSAASSEDARTLLKSSLDAAGVVPYSDEGKTPLTSANCLLLTRELPDGLAPKAGSAFGGMDFGLAGSADPNAPIPAGVRMGPLTVNGRLPPEVIQRVLRANFGRFRNCYESALKSNPKLAGRAIKRFVIDRAGAVTSLSDSSSTLPDKDALECIGRAMSSLKFPVPEGGVVTVIVTLELAPPAAKTP